MSGALGDNKMNNDLLVPLSGPEFVRGYYLTSSEHALSDISLRRLKVARFADANDPFELRALNCHERLVRQETGRFATSWNTTTGLLCFAQGWAMRIRCGKGVSFRVRAFFGQ